MKQVSTISTQHIRQTMIKLAPCLDFLLTQALIATRTFKAFQNTRASSTLWYMEQSQALLYWHSVSVACVRLSDHEGIVPALSDCNFFLLAPADCSFAKYVVSLQGGAERVILACKLLLSEKHHCTCCESVNYLLTSCRHLLQ